MVLVLRQKLKFDGGIEEAFDVLGSESPAPRVMPDLRRFLREMDSDCMEN